MDFGLVGVFFDAYCVGGCPSFQWVLMFDGKIYNGCMHFEEEGAQVSSLVRVGGTNLSMVMAKMSF